MNATDLKAAIRSTVEMAGRHAHNNSSADLCATDARRLLDDGMYNSALFWARRSLAHSVGVFHLDYKVAQKVYCEAIMPGSLN